MIGLLKYMVKEKTNFLFFLIVFFLNINVFSQSPLDTIDLNGFTNTKADLDKLNHYYTQFSGYDKNTGNAIANKFLELTANSNNDTIKIQRELLLGDLFFDVSNYGKSIHHYKDAFLLSKKLNYKKAILVCVNSIGSLYSAQRKSNYALKYYKEGILIAKGSKDSSALQALYGNLASAYYQLLEANNRFLDTALMYDDTLMYYAKANKDEGAELQLANANSKLVLHYTDAENFAKAHFHLNEALKYFLKHDVTYELSYLKYYQGRLFNAEKKWNESILSLKEAQKLAIETEDPGLAIDCYYELAQAYRGLGNLEESSKMYEEFILGNDSIINIETTNSINELSALYESEKKLNEIKFLNAENKSQKALLIASIIGIILLSLGAMFLLKLNRQKQELNLKLLKSTEELIAQKETVEKQSELIITKNNEITDSIKYASRIQKTLLTSEGYINKFLKNFFILYKPKDIVSGDFYWAYHKNDYLYFVTADCTGHGVPGAFMSMLNISLLNEVIIEKGIENPGEIFNQIRNLLIKALNPENSLESTKDGMDATLLKINLNNFELEIAAANNPVWIIRNNEIIEIKPDKMPIGIYSDLLAPFETKKISLAKEDWIITLTDGYPDQFGGEKLKKYKYSNLQKFILENIDETPNALKIKLEHNFRDWKGNYEQIDDVLISGIKI